MHQVALCLFSQPAPNGEILYDLDWMLKSQDWLNMSESLLLIGSQGHDYLKTLQHIPESEQGLPESPLVESCHRQRRAAFHYLKKALERSLKSPIEKWKGKEYNVSNPFDDNWETTCSDQFISNLGLNPECNRKQILIPELDKTKRKCRARWQRPYSKQTDRIRNPGRKCRKYSRLAHLQPSTCQLFKGKSSLERKRVLKPRY